MRDVFGVQLESISEKAAKLVVPRTMTSFWENRRSRGHFWQVYWSSELLELAEPSLESAVRKGNEPEEKSTKNGSEKEMREQEEGGDAKINEEERARGGGFEKEGKRPRVISVHRLGLHHADTSQGHCTSP